MPPAYYFLLFSALNFFCVSTSFAKEKCSNNVLSRLSVVEALVADVQKRENYLHLVNERLQEDNVKLRSIIAQLQKEVSFQTKQYLKVQRDMSIKTKQFTILKRRMDMAEKEMLSFKSRQPQRPSLEDSITYDSKLNVLGKKWHASVDQTGKKGSPMSLHVNGVPIQPPASQSSKQKSATKFDRKKRLTFANARVSFSAHMDSHATGLGKNQALVFELVNNNDGGAYNNRSGMFTAPVSGTYFFSASIFSHRGDEIYAEIVVNNVIRSRVGADGNAGEYGSGTNSLIVHLNKGDNVWIQHYETHGSKVYGATYSHFGGFILWESDNGVTSSPINVIG